jgi:hypothetical protein
MAWSDTNELEQLRVRFQEARRAYMAARKAAGLTNAAPRKVATSTTATTLTKSQKRFFENRRYCVGRDTTSIPGYVITTWHRNGRPDTKGPSVVTNALHNITGTVQNNPLQGRIAELLERATSAEARAERADRLKTWLEEQRDKALLDSTKKLYQAIIDRLDERLEGN